MERKDKQKYLKEIGEEEKKRTMEKKLQTRKRRKTMKMKHKLEILKKMPTS